MLFLTYGLNRNLKPTLKYFGYHSKNNLNHNNSNSNNSTSNISKSTHQTTVLGSCLVKSESTTWWPPHHVASLQSFLAFGINMNISF